MTIDERRYMLEQFLRSKNCYNAFMLNCKKFKQGYDNDTESLVMTRLPFDCISHAFTWVATDEGYEYWRDLAYEWAAEFKVVMYDNRAT